MFLITLSTGVFSELKMVMPFFVKSAEQFESHSCRLRGVCRFLSLDMRGLVWLFMITLGYVHVQKVLVEYFSSQGDRLWY